MRPAQSAVVPMLHYADGPNALDWLVAAFGFVETARWLGPDGQLEHGEVDAYGGRIMVASSVAEYEGPRAHAERCERAAAWRRSPYVVDGVLVHVPDVDGHLATARAAGAVVLSGPEGSPYGRLYRAEDVEGHRWMFLEEDAG